MGTADQELFVRRPIGSGHRRLPDVDHAAGEFARDEDDPLFCELHVNTSENSWPLLRNWLRPYWGISQQGLPPDLGFFEFMNNARRRGEALPGALIGLLLKLFPRSCGLGSC